MRAVQAGLLAQGLFLDLDLPAARAWKNSQPRLDDATVTRLPGLADPAAAAAVTSPAQGGQRLVHEKPERTRPLTRFKPHDK